MWHIAPLSLSALAIVAVWRANKRFRILTKDELIFWFFMIVVFVELLWMKFF